MNGQNSIMVIAPYWSAGTWVFDDPATGLVREPFVAGMDEILTKLTRHIPDARRAFRATFAAVPFPGHTTVLWWRREECGGNVYWCEDAQMEGWLCPALLLYFAKAPKRIYMRVDRVPT